MQWFRQGNGKNCKEGRSIRLSGMVQWIKLPAKKGIVLSKNIVGLIPAYNESAHIERVVQYGKKYLPVLVVDDGSKDDTAQKAEEAGAVVLRQVPNQGKGAALMKGFRYAIEQEYDAVVMLDADGQHDPDEIPELMKPFLEQGADLVVGLRDFSRMPIVRRCTNTIGRYMFSWALGTDIPDNQSGYRLLSSRLIEEMLKSREKGFEFEVEMVAVCVKREWKLAWVPIQTIYADEKSHIKPLRHVYHYFRIVLKARKMMRQ
jgi:glycosyltransferase involved in cell wall biosynthesis